MPHRSPQAQHVAPVPSEVSLAGCAETWPVAVLGGGAAGLMAALCAARAGARTVLLEGAQACGLKILVSGGGRCNVLPTVCDELDFMTSGSRNVVRRLLRTWPLAEVRSFFEDDLALALVTEPDTGKLFPATQDAHTVRDALVAAARAAGAEVRTRWRVSAVAPMPAHAGGEPPGTHAAGEITGDVEDPQVFASSAASGPVPTPARASDEGSPQARAFARAGFVITSADGVRIGARRLILATGGQSLPRTGSDGVGYQFATRLGHSLLPRYPALVPLTSEDPGFTALAGIALPVRWTVRRAGKVLESRERELLFTHRGFSGPAILDASHWAVRERLPIEIAWGALTPAHWREAFERAGVRTVLTVVSESLPRRLAELLAARAEVDPARPVQQLRRPERERLLAQLCACALPVTGDEGYRKAEVTGGGVPLHELNPSTLESRATAGLYLCGEILDAIGRIGGYNFLWAWVTGRLAGEASSRVLGPTAR